VLVKALASGYPAAGLTFDAYQGGLTRCNALVILMGLRRFDNQLAGA
jgi:hypothetical protein